MRTQQTNARNAQQSKKKKKRFAAVAVAGVIGLATAGGAYSYWTSLGGGTGTATTSAGASSTKPPFAVTGNAMSAMFPGDGEQPVTATITNNGSENYTVQALKAYITTGNTNCDGSNYLINGTPAPAGAPVAIPVSATDLAPGENITATFKMQFNNTNSNQDACKGAAVTINYSAS